MNHEISVFSLLYKPRLVLQNLYAFEEDDYGDWGSNDLDGNSLNRDTPGKALAQTSWAKISKK
jgi:hypothetical protein